MPPVSRLRAGVTLSVLVNLAGASAAVFTAVVSPGGPAAVGSPAAPVTPRSAPPAVGAFVASAPVAWVGSAIDPLTPPPPDGAGAADVAVAVDVEGDEVPETDVEEGTGGDEVEAEPADRPPAEDGRRLVSSTGYCLDGQTADGGEVGPGGVAMNGVPLGSRWRVVDGSLAGSVLTVNDRIGRGSDFDVWFDDCDDASAYGRQVITVVSEA